LLKASQEARKECAEILKSGGGSRFKKDLGDPKIWGLEDLPQFKQVVLQFEDDLQELVSWEEKQKQMLRDLRNSMLKGMLSGPSSKRVLIAQCIVSFSWDEEGGDCPIH